MNIDAQPENKGNILLVDDIPENLQLLSDLLVKLGYNIRSVTSGRMALKTIKAKQPDLILLDVKMPEIDGYQVCKTIKADESLRHIPVIFISALNDVFDKVTAFESGGIDYITKPFQIEEVIVRLENQLTIQKQKHFLQNEITKRKEAEEILYQSRALLASILNSSLDGIAALQAIRDPKTGDIEDFRCLVVNPVISKVFECEREDLIGKIAVRKFMNRIDRKLFEQLVNTVNTGESIERDFYYPFGKSCWYHFVAVKLGDGFAITVRDITARKQFELALSEANRKLELLANLDGLTQVANRRCFDNRLQLEWQKMSKKQLPISLILLDIDMFKSYNDCYGHLEGDDCLIKVAQTVQKTVNLPTDLVARYGGEEFTVLLPNTNLPRAIAVAKKIKSSILDLAIPHKKSEVMAIVTISLGISSLIPSSEIRSDIFISFADQALYHAKQNGRNCCSIYYENSQFVNF
jgi:two-component system, cell cycle response regulator